MIKPRIATVVVPLVSLFVLLAAPRAWALCPNCIAQSPASTLRLVGLFLLVPPAVFFSVAIAVRRILRRG
jgi:uncharacterized protein YjeT (DUF2065 family)